MQDKNCAELIIFEHCNFISVEMIRLIDIYSSDYQQVLELRNEVLRKPLGRNLSVQDIANDPNELIVVAVENGQVIASVQLRPLSAKTIKLRQMAVSPTRRLKAWGRKLLKFAEQTAQERGYAKIVLHARETAVDFYKKSGYRIVSDRFMEVGISHYKLEKQL